MQNKLAKPNVQGNQDLGAVSRLKGIFEFIVCDYFDFFFKLYK